MTSDTVPARIEASIEIAAPPGKVWSLVTDVARMASWSPQVVRTVVLGRRPLRRGTRFFNINRRGVAFWPTNAQVVRFLPHREFAFRVVENWTIWSFSLEETSGGTLVVQRREAPRGISPISGVLTKMALGGHEPFAAELLEGMHETLARIKAEAEDRSLTP